MTEAAMAPPASGKRQPSYLRERMERPGIEPGGGVVPRLSLTYATALHRCEAWRSRSPLAERHGATSYVPIAAGHLRRSDDAAVARRLTAPIRSLAISARKDRPPLQGRHRPCKPGKDALDSRTHGFS